MKTKKTIGGMAWALALLLPGLQAAELTAMNVASLPGDKVELNLVFNEPIAQPKGYTIENPARIAIDLPGVTSKLKNKHRELGKGNARSVTVVEAQERTRVIINMASLTAYNTRVEGNNLYVLVGETGTTKQTPAPAKVTQKPKAASNNRAIQDIDFQRGEQGEGNVIIELGSQAGAPDIQERAGKIHVNFPRTSLPDALRVRLDVTDFATPVSYVNASERSGSTNIVIEPRGNYDYLAYQVDNKLVVSVKPMTKAEQEKRDTDRFAYTGEKLSLNFQDIDVRSVLQLIADFTDLNLVASDTVQGNITLRLQSVPWDQALDLVLKTKGLDQRKVGNVLLVAPAEEIASRERQELENQQQMAELAPLRRELIQINYAKAAQIASLFQQVTGGQESAERGSVTVDDRTNSIIAYQTQERLEELRRIVAQLDIPVRQVMIEARIVEVNEDYSKELGVRWGGSFGRSAGSTASTNWSASGAVGGNNFVDLGATGATSGIGIGFMTNHALLDLQLSAMEKTGNGKIVSQPKVVTSDKETAKILKGAEIPYQEASSSGSTSTSFKEAALSLEVTPQITPDNRIIMEVKVTKDEPDFANALNGVPPIKKNEVNANILVADGETSVIGGVFSEQIQSSESIVPGLGRIPVIGRLFRHKLNTSNKTELLVFITPRVLNDRAAVTNY